MELMNALPAAIREELRGLDMSRACDIRLLADRPCAVTTMEGEIRTRACVSGQEIYDAAQALSRRTLRMSPASTGAGFLTLRGGHRMGLCGRVICQGQMIRALREISSFCIRIAGQWRGAADGLLPHLTDEHGRCRSILIVGLPGMGKTTLLRDSLRRLSEAGRRVCVVDERSEIAAMCDGLPQLEVGPCTDVLDGCGKEAGFRWLLRSLSPEVLATDELSSLSDAQAVLEAIHSGVSVLATVHGRELDSVRSRSALYPLVRSQAFDRYAMLDPRETGKLAGVFDRDFQPVAPGEEA